VQITAQQLFRDLEAGKWKPFYLIAGEEPFQTSEIKTRLKNFFVRDEAADSFNYETWDGDHLDAGALKSSLDQMPGLFSTDSTRLVVCHHFEKLSPTALETLHDYFVNPSPTTCFLMTAAKLDKRKAWYKQVDEKGCLIEVSEPYDREWPKWHGYVEKKLGKKIASDAWERLVSMSGRTLSILWSDAQRAATYVGESPQITGRDVAALGELVEGGDVFSFADDVLAFKKFAAIKRARDLVASGESEIKILSILVRQFRQAQSYLELSAKGITDSKTVAAQVGIHPFFVSKLAQQAKQHTLEGVGKTLELLASTDYQMKTGAGSLFELFLIPYFSPSLTPNLESN